MVEHGAFLFGQRFRRGVELGPLGQPRRINFNQLTVAIEQLANAFL